MDLGSSYLPSELLAAALTAQLESFPDIQRARQAVWAGYDQALGGGRARTEHPAHLYYLLMPDLQRRQGLIEHLRGRGVQAAFHYQPLHDAPAGMRFGRIGPGGCPVTSDIADRLVRLPMYPALSTAETSRIIAAVMSFRGTAAAPAQRGGTVEVPA
jgi:dTDP-4-amino-4,6-dideoxygalactose transaminase